MSNQSKNYIFIFIGALILYLVSTGVSYALFTNFGAKRESVSIDEKVDEIVGDENFQVDESLPKTEACPLNGKLYTKPERAIWEKRRPLAVMLENSVDARPQSGISKADIIYEAVAEGGITRFMGLFYCGVAEKTEFAPVRSARTYFVDWVSEYDALYNHVGGAGVCSDPTVDERAKALCQIDRYGIKDMDQFGISFPSCYRNPDRLGRPVATEHQMVCVSNNLFDIAKDRNWTNVDEDGVTWDKNFTSWKFEDEADPGDRGTLDQIDLYFWNGYTDFDVTWEYDAVQNVYKRVNGGQPHKDLEIDQQLTAKNVVIQFSEETSGIDEHKHLLYDTIGSDDALIFQNGEVIDGTWSKQSRTARTRFFDENGKEIQFVRGEIWIEIVPSGNKVTY
ncbi:MAG: hypothetical protein UU81_C0037G0006 [Microgenomates group bacterium GW2011_GWC1_41_8]|uniref:PT repeat-containing protein n=3 Tax=Candidatus Roizmaniibacteriota TaxID=1752723 RepID=A0A0G0XDD1_9BACT|nr:MAG: hypothetical protein UU14_C0019G0008 [Candidatus Roizmanbacteria bacterium GW2011_GWB1_40_7]KKR94080.1 MAG: hypothetical protein UU41_C0013G0002 [Candidatus Roizmanbacteria bacterium GW2011_GWA1_41_13]KKS22402.1 MAG: hypothetical protein UU78_C0017G0006 [Candidatus Roizmanbacteria bacterium GW2011_GWC2_41_7]KKS23218.1 MAG: hypothetical protein UU81_C0037G0006 [Microgenomates group bacterium GW2011_GWC1_41_8]OGK50743.1 MAG: hypothetical protein A3A55_03795 [Candidatus Roizmanbacteria bac